MKKRLFVMFLLGISPLVWAQEIFKAEFHPQADDSQLIQAWNFNRWETFKPLGKYQWDDKEQALHFYHNNAPSGVGLLSQRLVEAKGGEKIIMKLTAKGYGVAWGGIHTYDANNKRTAVLSPIRFTLGNWQTLSKTFTIPDAKVTTAKILPVFGADCGAELWIKSIVFEKVTAQTAVQAVQPAGGVGDQFEFVRNSNNTRMLFEDGKTQWTVVVSPEANVTEKFAAQELQSFLKRISGIDFPIMVTDEVEVGKKLIVVGSLDSSAPVRTMAKKLKLTKALREQLAIYIFDENLYLAGNCPRGTLYAVYEFLKQYLGCRWYWAGEDGEFVVPRKFYILPDLNYNYSPFFPYREMTPVVVGRDPATELWFARNGMNGGSRSLEVRDKVGFYKFDVGHWVAIRNEHADRMWKESPEIFQVRGGQRVHAPRHNSGCWSSPGFIKYVAANLVEVIRDRKLDVVYLSAADSTGTRCQCPECTKIPHMTTRWFAVCEKVMNEVRKECLDIRFVALAYQDYAMPPVGEIPDFEFIQFCGNLRCGMHKLDDSSCSDNAEYVRQLRAWSSKTKVGIYSYEFDIFKPTTTYTPIWNLTESAMSVFRDAGCVSIKAEIPLEFRKNNRGHLPLTAVETDFYQTMHRIDYYIFISLAWNPFGSADMILKDFCRHVYGPAAEPMYQYHSMMAFAWESMAQHIMGWHTHPLACAPALLNADRVEKAKAFLKKAENALDSVQDRAWKKRYEKNIAIDCHGFDYWKDMWEQVVERPVAKVLLLDKKDFGGIGALEPITHTNPLQFQNTEFRICRTKDSFHVQVIGMDSELENYAKDHKTFAYSASGAEFYIHFGDARTPVFRLHSSLSGGKFQKIGELALAPSVTQWDVEIKFKKDSWIMEFDVPFKFFGRTPKKDEVWEFSIQRFGIDSRIGFPVPTLHRMPYKAKLVF